MKIERLLKKLNRKVFGFKLLNACCGWLVSKLQMSCERFKYHKLDKFTKAIERLDSYYLKTIDFATIKQLKRQEDTYSALISQLCLPDPMAKEKSYADVQTLDNHATYTKKLTEVQSALDECKLDLELIKGDFSKRVDQLKARAISSFKIFDPSENSVELDNFTKGLDACVKLSIDHFEKNMNRWIKSM